MQDHHIAFGDLRQALGFHGRFDVLDRDLLAQFHWTALQRLEVQQDAAGEERFDMLDAQLLHAIAPDHLAGRDAVVEQLGVSTDADMCETVELGADLADLGRQEIVHPDHVVLAERPAGEPGGGAHREHPLAEQRHLCLIGAGKRDRVAGLDQLGGFQSLGRRHQVGGARLVIGAVFRGVPVFGGLCLDAEAERAGERQR